MRTDDPFLTVHLPPPNESLSSFIQSGKDECSRVRPVVLFRPGNLPSNRRMDSTTRDTAEATTLDGELNEVLHRRGQPSRLGPVQGRLAQKLAYTNLMIQVPLQRSLGGME